MPQILTPNVDPRYYAQPGAYRATIGAAAITAFPQPASQTALQAITGVQASATFAFTTQPVAGSTSPITVNGVPITFVASGGFSLAGAAVSGSILGANGVPLPYQAVGATGLQVTIGATLYATLLNLLGLLRSWPDESLQACNYRLLGGNTLRVVYSLTGTAGNSITVATSAGSNATLTGAATVASGTAGNTTLTGGAAPTSGYAVLVEPQPNPVELTNVQAVCRGYLSGSPTTNSGQAAGTLTLMKSDGSTLSKIPQGTITFGSGNTLSGTQEMAPIPFPLITAAATLVVQPWTGLYAYGGTTQVIDIEAAPAGAY